MTALAPAAWLNSDLTHVQDSVLKFTEQAFAPNYMDWEKNGIYPKSVWQQCGQAGVLCCDLPEAYGGMGGDYYYLAAVIEVLARAGFNSLGVGLSVHSGIVAHYILNHGSETQKQKYLPSMVRGELVGAIAMSEPGAGSDLQGIKTYARPTDGGFILNGAKTFITNGQMCDVVIVVAKTNSQVSGARATTLFLVDTNSPGFSRGRNLEKIGLLASDTSELFFDDVYVPETAVLGELSQGFASMMDELPRERMLLANGAMAACEGMLEWTLSYTQERQVFGQPVQNFQHNRFKLAEMVTETTVLRAFIDQCTTALAEERLSTSQASMAKLAATELQCKIADNCLQLFGGYGYMREFPIARAFVDARVQRIYGGTNEIMKEIIARSFLGK